MRLVRLLWGMHIPHYKTWAIAGFSALLGVIALHSMAAPKLLEAPRVSADVSLPFLYRFDVAQTIEEAGSADESKSPYFWLNSGGYLRIKDGYGSTVYGALPTMDVWSRRHAESNPADTDDGAHPQNIFRLFARARVQDMRQQAYFRVDAYHLSDSEQRAESNGILLMSRAKDDDNLYYAGLRVDGHAVIKKKIGGTYYTMTENSIVENREYDRDAAPNLLPFRKWIGLRSDVQNGSDGKVLLSLYADLEGDGVWKMVAQAVDDGTEYGGPALTEAGMPGIRTDFMDVTFDDYALSDLEL